MKPLLLFIYLLVVAQSYSQYYYNDIIANEQSNKNYVLLKTNRIKNIQVNSFDADNKPGDGLLVQEEFSNDWRKMVTTSAMVTGSKSTVTTTYDHNRVKRTDEITNGIQTRVDYLYNDRGQVKNITFSTTDTSLKDQTTETHEWNYNTSNQPELMLKIKNNTDTARIEFVYDEHGNVAEEHWKRKGLSLETYYYYYNAENRLTDIVRFNRRAQKLLPDFIFDYDEQGRVSQMTQVPPGNSNYLVWKYIYNDKGLKQEEICHNRSNELLGKIRYVYQ